MSLGLTADRESYDPMSWSSRSLIADGLLAPGLAPRPSLRCIMTAYAFTGLAWMEKHCIFA